MSDPATVTNHGKFVLARRGYQIHAWTGPSVDAGTMQPFSVQPRGGWAQKGFQTQTEAEAWIATAPALTVVTARIKAYVPVPATEDQIDDWIRFSVHATGSLSGRNPLVDKEFEAFDVDIEDVTEVR
jgi:hypothetical protein